MNDFKIEILNGVSVKLIFKNGVELIIHSENYEKYVNINTAFSTMSLDPVAPNSINLKITPDKRTQYKNRRKGS